MNSLVALSMGDLLLEKVCEVWEEISRYFREHFSDFEAPRPTLDRVSLPCSSIDEEEFLSTMFLSSLLNVVISEIDGCKSLSANWLNFSLYKKVWELVKEDVYVILTRFSKMLCCLKVWCPSLSLSFWRLSLPWSWKTLDISPFMVICISS